MLQQFIKALWKPLVVFFAIYIGSYYFITICLKFDTPGNSGEFGDTFGAVNALFGLIGILGILYSLRLQQEEIVAQKEAIIAQNKDLNLQRFEATFFTLLDTHIKIIQMLEGTSKSGYKYLIVLAERVRDINQMPNEEIRHAKRSSAVNEFYPTLSIYFQSLIQLYITIKKGKFDKVTENRFISILRTYITPFEKDICYAFENRLTEEGKGNLNFHYFIEEVLNESRIEGIEW